MDVRLVFLPEPPLPRNQADDHRSFTPTPTQQQDGSPYRAQL